MGATSSSDSGKKASPPVSFASRLSTPGFRSASSLIKDADGVDDYVRLPGQGHDFGQLMFAGVVASIADYDQHFLVAVPLLQVLESDGNRIVQRGLTIGCDSGQGNFQLSHLVGERQCCREGQTKPSR